MDDAHAWVEQRLLARALSALEPDDEARFDAHLQGCELCRQRHAELTAETAEDPAARGHLPAAMIARWERARAQLSGVERSAVQQHADRCATCRDDLRVAGHEPALAPVPAPTPASATPRTTAFTRATAPTPRATAPTPRGGIAGWIPWLGGGAIGALATAAVMVLMLRPTAPGTGPTTTPLPAAAPALVALPWVSPGAMRGSEVTAHLPAGARELALALAVPELEAGARRRLAVFAPDGASVGTVLLNAESVQAGTAIVMLRGPVALAAGSYRVVIREDGAPATSDSTETYFQLVPAP